MNRLGRGRRSASGAVALLLLAAAAIAGCGRTGVELGEGAWKRIDLTVERPRVEAGGRWLGPAPYERVHSYLGEEDVRDPERVPAAVLARFRRLSAGLVYALAQQPGSRLAWRLQLGSEPYFSFVPLRNEAYPCACTWRVSVEPEGGRREVVAAVAPRPVPPAPPPVEVDLARWSGQAVRLVLEVEAVPGAGNAAGGPGGDPRALWASPAIYGRGPAYRPRRRPGRPNVVLIGADTLRADALGAYGRRPTTTPALDALAAESDVWLEAYSSFNITNPSFASLMTGLYGKHHGIYDLKTPLPEAHVTLAERFNDAGYETWAVQAAAHLAPRFSGLGQGFERLVGPPGYAAAETAVDTAIDWIGGRRRGPFFLWLHLWDPHTPHTPPDPYARGLRPATVPGMAPVERWRRFRAPGRRQFEVPALGGERDLYSGEVAYLDRHVGRLLDLLDSRGLLEDTVIAFVADHGESLGEHEILYRHTGLWETTTHVPMMVRWPGPRDGGREGRRLAGLVQHLDLFPTLLAAAGIEPPPSDGRDLRSLAARGADGAGGRHQVFAEGAGGHGRMLRTRRFKLIEMHGNPQIADGRYLYRLGADPDELHNLAGRGHPVEERLARRLGDWAARRPLVATEAPRPAEMTPEESERLRALGYLD